MQKLLYDIFSFSIILIFSLILSLQDIKHKSVKIYIQLLSVFFALTIQFIFFQTKILIIIITGLAAGTFYFLIRKITKNKLGMADVLFGVFQGIFLLPKLLPVCIVLEVFIAFLFNIKSRGKAFAFIPFMAAALIITFIFQEFFFINNL